MKNGGIWLYSIMEQRQKAVRFIDKKDIFLLCFTYNCDTHEMSLLKGV